jgi:hypothetical protein
LCSGRNFAFQPIDLRIEIARIWIKGAADDKLRARFEGFAGVRETIVQFFDDRNELDRVHVVN